MAHHDFEACRRAHQKAQTDANPSRENAVVVPRERAAMERVVMENTIRGAKRKASQ